MSSPGVNHPSVDTILAGMSKDISYIVKSIDSIERKLEAKVDIIHFEKLESAFEEHRKETNNKITGHTVKLSLGAGIITALSWLIK